MRVVVLFGYSIMTDGIRHFINDVFDNSYHSFTIIYFRLNINIIL